VKCGFRGNKQQIYLLNSQQCSELMCSTCTFTATSLVCTCLASSIWYILHAGIRHSLWQDPSSPLYFIIKQHL